MISNTIKYYYNIIKMQLESRFGVSYGLCNVHKAIAVCPPLRPTMSAVGTPTYKFANFLVPILSCLTINKFTVKDSFLFAKEIAKQDRSFYMSSLHVDSLFYQHST